jgi:uncharacterized integral membrane protein
MRTTIQKNNSASPRGNRAVSILSFVTAIAIVITAIALAVACIHLYKTGGSDPYTRERAGAYLTVLLPFTLTCLLLVIALGVTCVVFGTEDKKPANKISSATLLKITKAKLASKEISETAKAATKKEQRMRKVWFSTLAAAILLLSAAVLIFALANTDSYTIENCTDKAAYIAVIASIAFVLAGALAYVCVTLADASYKRENAVLRAELAAAKAAGTAEADGDAALEKRSGHYVYILRGVILVAAVVFIILGITNGSMNDVLGKAVQICTECIGLG